MKTGCDLKSHGKTDMCASEIEIIHSCQTVARSLNFCDIFMNLSQWILGHGKLWSSHEIKKENICTNRYSC